MDDIRLYCYLGSSGVYNDFVWGIAYMNNEKKRNPYMSPENTAKVPCKNCKKRVVGCHATCEEYQKYKNDLEERKEKNGKHKVYWQDYWGRG